MDPILAPSQAYILLAITATVGSVIAALVHQLIPRRVNESPVVAEQSLSADRQVIGSRRVIVVGFATLFIVSWASVAAFMLRCVDKWSIYHWCHFIGLLLLCLVLLSMIIILSDRLRAVSTSFLDASRESPSRHSEASSGEDKNSGK